MDLIDDVGNPVLAIGDREELINLLMQSDPGPSELVVIEARAEEIQGARSAIGADIAALREAVEAGQTDIDMESVETLRQRAEGSEHLGELTAILVSRDSIAALLQQTDEQALVTLRTSRSAEELSQLAAAVGQLQARYPVQAANPYWAQLATAAESIIPTMDAAMITDEQERLTTLHESVAFPEPITQAIVSRRVQLDSIENAGRAIYEEAVSAIEDNRIVEARAILIALLGRDDLSRTSSYQIAGDLLSGLDERLRSSALKWQSLQRPC